MSVKEVVLPLSENQQSKLLEFLNSKWVGERNCPICNENNWNLHPEMYELRTFNKGKMVLGGPLVPLVILECKNCGNTFSINAIKAGIVPPEAGGIK